ncbi:MAG TPA: polysaccharide deacetylase family protein [Ktedonobacteraceae bacterium]|nr:polysaccharide deacetylase family protein [Ktedonobacteraceae bacterium]
MNLVSFSIRTKGAHNFARRLGTVFTRFGLSEAKIRNGLFSIVDALRQCDSAPTFFIPAVVLGRHPALICEIARGGAEIGVHGYVHNDYRTLSREQQYKQTKKAVSVFGNIHLPYYGFRNPYLGWTKESLEIYTALGFRYESNVAVLHDVVDLNTFSPLLRSGFAKSLKLFQAIPCSTYALRPHFEGDLLRIPTSIPDDEMLFDRLRITNPAEVGRIWSRIMQRVYELGGLYTLNLHPERGVLCRQALEALLASARSQPLPVWVARIGDIAQWWKERSEFRLHMESAGDNRWRIEATCAPRATILARHLSVEDQPAIPWFGADGRVQSRSFIVNAPACPCIAVSPQTPGDIANFLYEQGYPVKISSQEEAYHYALYLDRPEGLGRTSEQQASYKQALVNQIETLEQPLVHFGCWPDGSRAALAISGDIDSVTMQDFFLRIVEVFRHR